MRSSYWRGFAETDGGGSRNVVRVTTLDDSGAGSLRAALSQSGQRRIVFDVSGEIALQTPLLLNNPYANIQGQTSLEGITLTGHGLIIGETHDVIVQHLRSRPGATAETDAFLIRNSHDIVLDHCSGSWATDEIFDIYDSYNVTVRWCMFYECLLDHSMGALIKYGSRRVTMHHCLFAHNKDRNPKFHGSADMLNGEPAIFDFRNNVVYNFGQWATVIEGVAKVNAVGNVYIEGPSTTHAPDHPPLVLAQGELGRGLYLRDNKGRGNTDGTGNNWNMVYDTDGQPCEQPLAAYAAPQFEETDLTVTLERVLKCAGATQPQRDVHDRRIVQEVLSGTGSLKTALAAILRA